MISLAAVRSTTTSEKSVTLMADSSVDFASRLSAPRASRRAVRAELAPVASTTSTTEPAPPTTRPKPKPVVKAATVTTAKPVAKKAAAPPPKPAASTSETNTAAPRPMPARGGQANSEEGKASWYEAKYHASNPWICAHKTIAKGTVLTVTNVKTGAWITCEVGDRGPYVEGRILDLSKHAFSQLANPSSGLVWVKISY